LPQLTLLPQVAEMLNNCYDLLSGGRDSHWAHCELDQIKTNSMDETSVALQTCATLLNDCEAVGFQAHRVEERVLKRAGF
jgi:hypothetical protein